MTTAVLDTLRCAQTLKDAGFAPKQAEATAQVLGDALADVATKADVERLETKLDDAVGTGKTDLDRHTAMQETALERHAASHKADFERLEAKLDDAVSSGRSDLESHAATHKAALDNAVAGLNAKIDAVEQKLETKIDAVEQKLGEKIDGRFNTLNRNIIVLNGLVFVMLGAVLAFAFKAMAPASAWSGEPHAAAHPAGYAATAEVRPAPSEPLLEPHPSTPPTSPAAPGTSNAPGARPADAGGMPPIQDTPRRTN